MNHPDRNTCLDSTQLHELEQSFRRWTGETLRPDVRIARYRILIIFLLIRYTGAKLSEVLNLDPFQDIDVETYTVSFGRVIGDSGRASRKVHLPEAVCREIRGMIAGPGFKKASAGMLRVDPGFVRRKFYERAEACGFIKALGAPEPLRRSRAVELIENNMPFPAVQMMMGHSTPNPVSSYISFSEEEIREVTRFFMEKESRRKTSARNSFFGKIGTIQEGDIQTRIELITLGGHKVTTIITNDSVKRLGLKKGKWITAEIKAPWVILDKSINGPESSADNVFNGVVEKIIQGEINTEYRVRISDGTKICSIVTSESCRRLALGLGDRVWVLFNSASVVLMTG
ncbi:MAG: transporter [Desulfobacterales bacterium RIFOXYA12_FULL_46_15]|nr:MAG: transporter [Desulfobacterales bacterium RIFOXYA12_FULL_46_15]